MSVRQRKRAPRSSSPAPTKTSAAKATALLHPSRAELRRVDGSVAAGERGAHYLPTHVAQHDSLLTSSELATLNVSGLANLGALLLLVHNLRLVLENLFKHGWLFGRWFQAALFSRADAALGVALLGACLLPCVLALASERLAAAGRLGERATSALHRLCVAAVLGVPTLAALYVDAFPPTASAALAVAIVTAMKLHSYSLVNRDVRRVRDSGGGDVVERVDGVDEPVVYPANLTYGDLFYFLAAPTLCYQLNYPRTSHIRWPFVARRTAQMIFLITIALFIAEQYVAPTVRGAEEPLRTMAIGRVAERVLKLAVPSLYCWMCGFAVLFHYYLNILAELLRFADRRFYDDWWNSPNMGTFWQKWNRPVGNWLKRHVYAPARRRGLSQNQAGFYVFLLSAVAHEALISIPCKMFSLLAFFAMLGQLPLIVMTKSFRKGSMLGNVLFWTTFCIFGQPLSVLLYFISFLKWREEYAPRLNAALESVFAS